MKNARTYFLHMRKVGENCVLEGGDTVKSIKTHENRKFSDIMVFELMNFVKFGVRWRWILFTANIYAYVNRIPTPSIKSIFQDQLWGTKVKYLLFIPWQLCYVITSNISDKKSVVNTILILVLLGTRQS